MDPFFVRNLVFGLEDSVLSTTGLVIGISLTGMSNADVVKSGIILLLVESLSMAFGSFISEDSFLTRSDVMHTWKTVVYYAAVMFASYAAAGLVSLSPFLLDVDDAWKWSAGLGLSSLLTLLYWYQDNHENRMKKALLLTSIASSILAISVITGSMLKK